MFTAEREYSTSNTRSGGGSLLEQPELAAALRAVMNATEPVPLEPIIAYKLSSMGLIKLYNNQATISCQLYRQYFSQA